jgi:uncharacterized protein
MKRNSSKAKGIRTGNLEKDPGIYFRLRYLVFAFFLLMTPVVIYGAHRALQSNTNNIEDWLPGSFEETLNLRWFGEHFGTDSFLMMSWEGCRRDDPRLAMLADELRKPLGGEGSPKAHMFSRIITSQEVSQQLASDPLSFAAASVTERLKGWLLGQDGETACIVAVVSDEGFRQRHTLSEMINACAKLHPEFAGTEIYLAGSVLDSAEIDHASSEHIVLLSLGSFLLCFVIMVIMLRSMVLSGMILANALFCHQLALAIIHFSGTEMDSILLMVPMLVFILAISTGVHLVNYYRDSVRAHGVQGAPLRAVREAIAPCWLASLTTAIGVMSLMLSQLVPVQKFGFFAGVVVLAGTGVLFTLLPCQFEQVPLKPLPQKLVKQNTSRLVLALQRFVISARSAIIIMGFLLTGLGVYGVSKLQAGVRIHDMFSPGAKIIADYDWLETHVGPLVPFEIVLRLPKTAELAASHLTILQRLQLVAAIHRAAKEVDGIGAVVSPLNFSPPLQGLDDRGTRALVRRTVISKKLEAARGDYMTSGLVVETETEELWRISGRAYAGRDSDYGKILDDLQANVSPILGKAFEEGYTGISIAYCGGVPLVQKAQRQMLSDLLNSFLAAFVCIAVIMGLLMAGLSLPELRVATPIEVVTILVRSFVGGLLAMIPSILPCAVVLGAMGLWGMRMEIGSMMTASVALGIAVDDTLHYLTWFRRATYITENRAAAVALAYEKCAAAMVQTSIICGLGLLTYALSSFVPVARFSWVMVAMLTSALLADLLIFPAMLLSPLGILFEPIKQRCKTTALGVSARETS